MDVDLFIVHVIFRAISLRAHYAGRTSSVPLFDAWTQALDESTPIIAKLHQYGCTKFAQLSKIPLASIGIRGRTVLLMRSVLWHVGEVLKLMRARSPYEMTLHLPPPILSENFGDDTVDDGSKREDRRDSRKGPKGRGRRKKKKKKKKHAHNRKRRLKHQEDVHYGQLPGIQNSGYSFCRPSSAPQYVVYS